MQPDETVEFLFLMLQRPVRPPRMKGFIVETIREAVVGHKLVCSLFHRATIDNFLRTSSTIRQLVVNIDAAIIE